MLKTCFFYNAKKKCKMIFFFCFYVKHGVFKNKN